MLGRILAQAEGAAADQAERIAAIEQMVREMHAGMPEWAHQGLLLTPVAVLIVMVLVWQRQKTIARNQVQIGKMVEDLLEKRR